MPFVESLALLLALAAGCNGCRVRTLDCEDARTMELPSVPVGGTLLVRVPFMVVSPGAADAAWSTDGLELSRSGRALDVAWTPDRSGVEASACVVTDDGASLLLRAVATDDFEHAPSPPATSMGYEVLDSVPESELGEWDLAGAGSIPFAADPASGNAWFGDAAEGRAWRLDPFYNHPRWGLWAAHDREDHDEWRSLPSCFLDTRGVEQDGTCTGAERDRDGEIPDGWTFFHGGFAGDGEFAGLTDLVADPDRGRVWTLGPGELRAIDTDLHTTDDEAQSSYTFTQAVPDFRVELGAGWNRPRGAVVDDALWIVDVATGRLGRMPLPPDGQPPALVGEYGGAAIAAFDESRLYLADPAGVRAVALATGVVEWEAEFAEDLLEGGPVGAWAEDGGAWFAWPDLLVAARDGEAAFVRPPDGGTFAGLALDRVAGGSAAPLDLLYVAGQTDGRGWLRAATPDGAWLPGKVDLAAPPLALGHARPAHDLYLLYGAGSELCAISETDSGPDLAEACTDGAHPAVVEPMYDPYGLVPPSSEGHPLNLFIAPIVETPKDESTGADFTGSQECGGGDGLEAACCALQWALDEFLAPNVAYFTEEIQSLGLDTETTDDDPTMAWGVNPSFLRQARDCLDSDDPGHQAAGVAAYAAVAALAASERAELIAWTHTGAEAELEEHQRFYLSLVGEEGVDWDLPIDSQAEYLLLHEGMAALFWTEDDPRLPAMDLWTPIGSGNSLDAATITSEADGWPDDGASWVTAIRDGSLPTAGTTRSGYVFLSAGAELEIGNDTYRKKELWPLDIRQRPHVAWLAEDPARLGEEDAQSGVANLPGLSWEVGVLVDLGDAGAYKESQKYGQTVTERNWEYVFRYVRRLAATGDPDRVKCWYQHIYNLTAPDGQFPENSGVVDSRGSPTGLDVNRDGIERIRRDLIEPGFARWALPSEVLAEFEEVAGEESAR